MKISNEKTKFIVSVVAVVLINLALIFGVYFSFKKFSSQKTIFDSIKKDLAFYENKIENIRKTNKERLKTEENRKKIKKIFLNEENIIDLIKRVEWLASQADVDIKINRINITNQLGQSPVFDLLVTGSFGNIYKMISMLENDIYQFSFNKVYLQGDRGINGWEASLELKFLSFTTND